MIKERICIRIPKEMLKQLDEIDEPTNTRSYKIRRAIKKHCEKELDKLIKNL